MRFLLRYLPRRGFRPLPRDPRNTTTQRASLAFAAAAAIPMATYSTTVTKPSSLAPTPDDVEAKAHHVKNRRGETTKFTNPPCLMQRTWPNSNVQMDDLNVVEPEFLASRTGKGSSDKLRATWLGHACYYVEFPSGLRVLFDPVFEDCCTPFQWLPPRRFTPPPCDVAALPHIDAVVVSHSHYDHLSYPTVKSIQESHPDAHFFVGLGSAKWFHQSGIPNVTEMDWWEDVELTLTPKAPSETEEASKSAVASAATTLPQPITARFSCLPCQHRSGRGILDQMTTLWCSWAVSSPGPTAETTKSVWFGGDTGYRSVPKVPEGADDYGAEYAHLPVSPQFAQIGTLRGPFDLGLIPIGAYAPRHIFSHMHCNPYDAVEIFRDTQCRRAMAIHHGTWALTAEDVKEPPKMLKEALKRKGIEEAGVFDTCDPGETREF
ncbi:N-acyl-phosphatidylethanolamine-hydrolyzing phospholipase D [Apiospora arundinis]